jgi:hypothetical protein
MFTLARNLCAYRVADAVRAFDSVDPGFELRLGVVEQSIRAAMVRADEFFYGGRYALALESYQGAYAEVYRYLHPDLPSRFVAGALERLARIDVLDGLLSASAEVARFRRVAGVDAPLASPSPPSPELVAIVSQAGVAPTMAESLYQRATTYMRAGVADRAQMFLEQASAAADATPKLRADIDLARGVALMPHDQNQAIDSFHRAQEGYRGQGLSAEEAVASNNLAVLHTLAGNAQAAGDAFRAAGDRVPVGLARTLMQPLNPGIASTLIRPMGVEGLQSVLPHVNPLTPWQSVDPTRTPVPGDKRLSVAVGAGFVQIDLLQDPAVEFRTKLFQPRILATSVEDLTLHLHLGGNFVAYLAHLHGFTLPMSMGDCYTETQEYEKAIEWYTRARDYAFLNKAIEAPVVWRKLATACLRWGDQLYAAGDKGEARARYERIIRLTAPILDPASPLYFSPVFDDMKAEVDALLAAPEPVDARAHDPTLAAIVLRARLNLRNIDQGIDLPLLSLNPEQIPVFRFDYLQDVARYFANHAIEAERAYVQFQTSAEQGQLTRANLQGAVDLGYANEQLEAQKVRLAQRQKEAADANRAYAQTALDDANKIQTEYGTISARQVALDANITVLSSPATEMNFTGWGNYGIADGKHEVREVLRSLARQKSELSRKSELLNLDARVRESGAALDVAEAQQTVAQAQVDTALVEQQIAGLRRQQAEQQLALFNSQEFTPELWHQLANEMKDISRAYLQQAVIIARLMERAYEFEIGDAVGVIRRDYTRSDLSGLLAGDLLLRDIDSFTALRILHTNKKQPVKEVVSLDDRFPIQFQRDFQRTGRMKFRTALSDFDASYPGAYQHRIKRVEVVVEGLVRPTAGLHGTLVNTGLCLARRPDGRIQMRLLQPETLLLSSYRIGPDSVVFTPDLQMLSVFEGSPVSSSWELELRPAVNDLIFSFVTDVKLIVYYECYYSEALKQPVLEQLAETQPYTARRSMVLRSEMFDEFFALQDTGEVSFTILETMLPFYHRAPQITQMTVILHTEDAAASMAGLEVRVTAADGSNAQQTTDADGAIANGPGAALNALLGQQFLQKWTIAIPRADNQARFDAGFNWSQVTDIVFVGEYDYTPRAGVGEPVARLRETFDDDPLAKFEVVDDPGADRNGPSAWSFDPAQHRVRQTSSIAGGPDGPATTDPAKPGTYLVLKSTAAPALANLVLSSTLLSSGAGAMGLVFRWKNVDNFYFFVMDSARNYRRLGKKIGGVFHELDTAAFDASQGFIVGRPYRTRIRLYGTLVQAFLDDMLVLSGQDASMADPGRAGFYTWNNPTATFADVRLIEL